MNNYIFLNSFIDTISKYIAAFSSSWFYAGALIFAAIAFTFTFGFFQFRKLNQMRKCYFSTENIQEKKISPLKVFVTSLAAKFGLGNLIGVGFAVVVGGPGIVIWMIIVGMFSMAVSLVENILGQIYHEKDHNNKNIFKGGPAFYIYKGLGKGFLWCAITYAIASIVTKSIFVVGAASGTLANTFYFIFGDHFKGQTGINGIPTDQSISDDYIVWIIVGLLALALILCILGGVKRIIKVSNIVSPITFGIFLIFVILYISFNIKYLPPSIKYIFEGFIDPQHIARNVMGGASWWTLATCIKQGAIRGIFAHEAGQGSTPHFSSIPKLDHPTKMGFGQSLAVFTDIAIICTLSGVFYTMSLLKFHDLAGDGIIDHLAPGGNSNGVIQSWFTTWAAFNFLPHSWTVYLSDHGSIWVNYLFAFIFSIVLLGANLGIALSSMIIVEFDFIFLMRKKSEKLQKKWIFVGRFITPIGVCLAPLLGYFSKSIFSLSDAFVALCFILNMIGITLLLPAAIKTYRDFENQAAAWADKTMQKDHKDFEYKNIPTKAKMFWFFTPWKEMSKMIYKRHRLISNIDHEFIFDQKKLNIKDKTMREN